MQFRQKLAFFMFGCAFVIIGQVLTGLVVPRAEAQSSRDARFGTIQATAVELLDDSGDVRAVLGHQVDERGTETLADFRDRNGLEVAAVQVSYSDGGASTASIHLTGQPTEDDPTLRYCWLQSNMIVMGGSSGGTIMVQPILNAIWLTGEDGRQLQIGGGYVDLLAGDKVAVQLKSDEAGGRIGVADLEGRPRAVVAISEGKGVVMTVDAAGGVSGSLGME
ncbi:hypothetical protein HN371_28980 [Candidatus Poribacteria bacterium]|nr:hypothetical protein [Candidatus Poribacteria bacterium]MBT5532087.1 hypothetical protein [Candidatus Poribacteria bacterium]